MIVLASSALFLTLDFPGRLYLIDKTNKKIPKGCTKHILPDKAPQNLFLQTIASTFALVS